MKTTSKIYDAIQHFQSLSKFNESLNELMEKYNIEDSVFVYENGLKEVCNGYFVPLATFESLEEALGTYLYGNGIRILNNKEFQLGEVHKYLHECESADKIFDIELLKEV